MEGKKWNAVIYCRCSTEEESQADALQAQVREARACATANGWQLVGEYVEAKSGTTVKGRWQYQRLYRDLAGGQFDIIIIKSQDRLMRNVKDWYLFIDRMVKNEKRLYLYLERKFYSSEDSLITGIRAILAEDYSKELSKKINYAHRKRQKEGGNLILTNHAYGFRKKEDKSVELIEEEAEVKRQMYQLCAQGYGCRSISNILYQEGIRDRRGNKISETAVRRIIRSPLNKGEAVFNRQHYDFETKQTVRMPPKEWIVHSGMLPATVSEELWERANMEMDKRMKRRNSSCPRGSNPGKSALSGKIKCGKCGAVYYRRSRMSASGRQMAVWSCSKYLGEGRQGCDNIHLAEESLNQMLEEMYRKYTHTYSEEAAAEDAIEILEHVIKNGSANCDTEKWKKEQKELETKKNVLIEKLLDGVITDQDFKRKRREIDRREKEIEQERKECEIRIQMREDAKHRIAEIRKKLVEQIVPEAVTARMAEDISKIQIYPGRLVVSFEALPGMSFSVDPGGSFDSKASIKRSKEEIVRRMEAEPQITAKKLAEEMKVSLPACNYRIGALKKEGRIRFEGKGGRGKWVVTESMEEN